jgi:hypothetical protein
MVTIDAIATSLESNLLDTSGASSGNGSVHSLSRGKIGVGCIDVGGSLKMLTTVTPP